MNMDPAQFTTALHQHLCVIATTQDNKQIQESTRLLKKQFYSNPQCVPSILQIIAAVNDIPVNVRQLAAVEGRKQVKQHWKKLSPENRDAVKEKILEYVIQEPDIRVQQSLTHIVAAIGQKELRRRKWGQLVDTLMNGCRSSDIRHREVCLLILRELMADIVVAYEENRVLPVLELIATHVQDPDHPHLRLLATEAISSAASVCEKKNKRQVQFYRSMIPHFFQVLTTTFTDEALAKRSFEAFDHILSSECAILNPHFVTFVQLLVATFSNASILSEVRVLAGNAIVLLPLYKRKLLIKQKLIEPILDHILPLTIDATFEDDDAADTPGSVALRIIHAFTSYLPPKHLFPVISQKLTTMAQDPNPSIRISAIRCLGLMVDGCADQLRVNLETSIQLLCQQMMDTHANVRKAACETLSQFFEVFGSDVATYHSHLIPRLLDCAQDPHAKLMATNALDVLLENMDSDDVVGYLPSLVQTFLVLLQDPDIDVRQQTGSAVGSVAHCAGEAFRPYFPHVFPSILNLLSLSNQSDSKEMVLRGIGIDTMSAIAQAVGPDVFREQVSVVCPLIVESMHMKAPKLKECAFCFFGVLSSTFKREFSPFLSGLVPALFESVLVEETPEVVDETQDLNENQSTPLRLNAGGQPVDLDGEEDSSSTLDEDEDDEEFDLDDEDGDEDEFGASNMLAEEKATAIEVLGQLFESTEQDFLPYLEESTTHVLSQAQHYNEEVRKNVLVTLCKFMEQYYTLAMEASISVPSEAHASSFTRNIMNTILPVLEEEEAPLVLSEAFDNLQSLLRSMKGQVIEQDPTHLERLCQILLAVFNGQHISQKSLESRTDEEGNEEDGEVDAGEVGGDHEDDLNSPFFDNDESALVSACDVMSALCHALGPKMASYVAVFLPELMKRLEELEPDELSSVIGSFADVCVGLKSGVNGCVHLLLPVFQQMLTQTNVDAMSNALYGLGVLVHHCELPLDEASIIQHVLPCFKSSLLQCVDNACGALARILHKKQEWGWHPELVPILLDHLPLREDFQENEPVFLYLHFLLHHHFNACTPFLPKLLHILAHAFMNPEERLPFPEVSASTLHLLKSLFNPMQPGVQESIQALPNEMQAALQKALYQ